MRARSGRSSTRRCTSSFGRVSRNGGKAATRADCRTEAPDARLQESSRQSGSAEYSASPPPATGCRNTASMKCGDGRARSGSSNPCAACRWRRPEARRDSHAEGDMQELRLAGPRPKDVVVVITPFGTEEHSAVARHIGDPELESISIEADGLGEIIAAENDVIDQLRRRLLVPRTVLVPPDAAARRIDLILLCRQRLPFEHPEADAEPQVIGAVQRTVGVFGDDPIFFRFASISFSAVCESTPQITSRMPGPAVGRRQRRIVDS